ncbi:phage integrase N-terminal SAM-like domain-containing protein [Lactiplantibacillus modestisalitolerans]|uniref:Phage integrase N-terminal SAM-like domain-containing protein n=1 Tax=Lactiplantibacillus modestisalitolerans TaxID=1457219 RepID=A0ABV5WWR4_9LACO|nr:phage integrase N-terminal SAM-like domain-containing protein [Lactiplantibacillus modestisalitolerans]
MATKFPYEKSFVAQLRADGKQAPTILQYQLTLADFFNYEQHFNETFAASQLLADLTENDVRTYLEMLQTQRQFKPSTLNKSLSNLNGYFSYLFEHRIITTLPTFKIKGQPRANDLDVQNWPQTLPTILTNHDLHVYTRLFLLLTCKAYTATEMLAPGFYQELVTIPFSATEQAFLQELQHFIEPRQASTGSPDIFLKSRQRGTDPHLTLAALHKYLTGDSQRLGMPLKPIALRQSFMLWYLDQHRTDSIDLTMKRLRLDLSSLDYYQNLLRRQDLRAAKQGRD